MSNQDLPSASQMHNPAISLATSPALSPVVSQDISHEYSQGTFQTVPQKISQKLSKKISKQLISRRGFIATLGASTALALGSGLFPGQAFATARTDKRLIVIILRGGMDGLAALAPYGDTAYHQTRGDLALDPDSLLKIDPFFGLHPSLTPLADLYKKGEMIALPASATPYRNRSHFDAQNVLELGSDKPHALNSGWLNRLVGAINVREGNSRSKKTEGGSASPEGELGLAFGSGLPLIMRGDHDVNAWSPSAMPDTSDDYMSLVQRILCGYFPLCN